MALVHFVSIVVWGPLDDYHSCMLSCISTLSLSNVTMGYAFVPRSQLCSVADKHVHGTHIYCGGIVYVLFIITKWNTPLFTLSSHLMHPLPFCTKYWHTAAFRGFTVANIQMAISCLPLIHLSFKYVSYLGVSRLEVRAHTPVKTWEGHMDEYCSNWLWFGSVSKLCNVSFSVYVLSFSREFVNKSRGLFQLVW